jgi:hypothetical protein
MTQRCHLDPTLFRACKNDFQLPQAILAFGGNWLIPKRKILRVISGLKAGDDGACQSRSLSWTLPHGIRGKREAKVFHYATGIRCVKATRHAFRSQGATLGGKPALLSSTPTHLYSPPTNAKTVRSQDLASEEGKRNSQRQISIFLKLEK